MFRSSKSFKQLFHLKVTEHDNLLQRGLGGKQGIVNCQSHG